jgi:ribokinase
MFDIIAIGSATEDVFVASDDTHVITLADRHGERPYLALEYGAKVPVSNLVLATGGGATNTAVSFARQGLATAALCKLGQDGPGDRVLDALSREGIDTSLCARTEALQTGYSLIITGFTGDRTVLVYRGAGAELTRDEISWDALAQAQWLYLGSLTGASAPLYFEVAQFAREKGVKLATNPGGTQIKLGLEALTPALKGAHMVFLNMDEARELACVEQECTDADEHEVLKLLYAAGCRYVVVTDGERGAHAYDGTAHYHVPVYPAEKASTLGAGDAFAAACIVGLHRGLTLRDALRCGAANAASVVSHFGAKEGILSWEGIQRFIAGHGDDGLVSAEQETL